MEIGDYVCVLKTDERGEIVLTWVKKDNDYGYRVDINGKLGIKPICPEEAKRIKHKYIKFNFNL